MSLYTGPQLIFGKKLFKNQVVFKDAVAFEKGWTGHRGETSAIRDRGMGELHILTPSQRPSAWVVNASTTTGAWTDVDFGAYVPQGVTALLLKTALDFVGDGSLDYSVALLRPNGSSVTDSDQCVYLECADVDRANTATGADFDQRICLCDRNGVIQYYLYAASAPRAAGILYLTIEGYTI